MRIIHNNCIDELKKLKDNEINLIFTSPPFKKEDVNGPYWGFFDIFMKEARRVTSDYLVIFQSANNIYEMCRRYPKPKHIVIWSKKIQIYKRKYNPIFYYDLGSSFNINKPLFSDVWPFAVKYNKRHKYEDPKELYRALLGFFPKEWRVLDPFAGSGTTAVICKERGNDFIGFETELCYIDVIKERLQQTNLINVHKT